MINPARIKTLHTSNRIPQFVTWCGYVFRPVRVRAREIVMDEAHYHHYHCAS